MLLLEIGIRFLTPVFFMNINLVSTSERCQAYLFSVDHGQKETELIFFFPLAVSVWWTETSWGGITPSRSWGCGLVCRHVSASKSTPGSGDGLTGPPWRPGGRPAWQDGHGQSPVHPGVSQTCASRRLSCRPSQRVSFRSLYRAKLFLEVFPYVCFKILEFVFIFGRKFFFKS